MKKNAFLVLSDGSVYQGSPFGAETTSYGEVVFNTSMVGYQEILTDPSYAGQIVVPTYPLIGNYGINESDIESNKIQVSGFVVRENCLKPNHYKSKKLLNEYLIEYNVAGISDVDTRAITRKLRSAGVMMGVITSELTPEQALAFLQERPNYGKTDFVKQVSTANSYEWDAEAIYPKDLHIVVLDCGVKYNILRLLRQRGCRVTTVPCTTSADDILQLGPDGILLSPGPGNPELLDYLLYTVKILIHKLPVMGICLGCQIISRTFGGKTYKLKFGHRGANHPVKDLQTGKVYITSQNHGYAVDPDSLPDELVVTHINLNDNTVEGVAHKSLPVFSIQYHSEDSPGPQDNRYLFDKFLKFIKNSQNRE